MATQALQSIQRFRQKVIGRVQGSKIPQRPKFSLRQQALLVKNARASNTLHLLPPGPKLYDPRTAAFELHAQNLGRDPVKMTKFKRKALMEEASRQPLPPKFAKDPHMQNVIWEGKFEREAKPGAALGTRLYSAKRKMFKGHRPERLAPKKMVYRKILLRDMNRRIERFKEYHRKRLPNPLSEPKLTAKAKVPF